MVRLRSQATSKYMQMHERETKDTLLLNTIIGI